MHPGKPDDQWLATFNNADRAVISNIIGPGAAFARLQSEGVIEPAGALEPTFRDLLTDPATRESMLSITRDLQGLNHLALLARIVLRNDARAGVTRTAAVPPEARSTLYHCALVFPAGDAMLWALEHKTHGNAVLRMMIGLSVNNVTQISRILTELQKFTEEQRIAVVTTMASLPPNEQVAFLRHYHSMPSDLKLQVSNIWADHPDQTEENVVDFANPLAVNRLIGQWKHNLRPDWLEQFDYLNDRAHLVKLITPDGFYQNDPTGRNFAPEAALRQLLSNPETSENMLIVARGLSQGYGPPILASILGGHKPDHTIKRVAALPEETRVHLLDCASNTFMGGTTLWMLGDPAEGRAIADLLSRVKPAQAAGLNEMAITIATEANPDSAADVLIAITRLSASDQLKLARQYSEIRYEQRAAFTSEWADHLEQTQDILPRLLEDGPSAARRYLDKWANSPEKRLRIYAEHAPADQLRERLAKMQGAAAHKNILAREIAIRTDLIGEKAAVRPGSVAAQELDLQKSVAQQPPLPAKWPTVTDDSARDWDRAADDNWFVGLFHRPSLEIHLAPAMPKSPWSGTPYPYGGRLQIQHRMAGETDDDMKHDVRRQGLARPTRAGVDYGSHLQLAAEKNLRPEECLGFSVSVRVSDEGERLVNLVSGVSRALNGPWFSLRDPETNQLDRSYFLTPEWTKYIVSGLSRYFGCTQEAATFIDTPRQLAKRELTAASKPEAVRRALDDIYDKTKPRLQTAHSAVDLTKLHQRAESQRSQQAKRTGPKGSLDT